MHGTSPGEVAGHVGPGSLREQVPLRFVLMRGGTSRAVFLREGDLPRGLDQRARVILAVFGSPDPRQVDGLGGADLLTSKCAIIGPPSRPDADLDYTFAQVSVTEPVVDFDMNCGNISAAVGVYALQEGLVRAADPTTRVRIHNTNTGRVLVAEVPVLDGEPLVEGDLAIDGVPGTGAPILMDYGATAGGRTGMLLPTGQVAEDLEVGGLGRIRVSIVDLANLSVFFPAGHAGMTGAERPGEITQDQLAVVAAIKRATAAALGIANDGQTPIPVAVAPPAGYLSFAGRPVTAGEISLLARVIGGKPPVLHKAFPGTTGACVAVAAAIPGTVVAEVSRALADGDPLIIGHPSGVVPVWGKARLADGTWTADRAVYARTARRVAEGHTYVRRSAWPASAAVRPLAAIPHEQPVVRYDSRSSARIPPADRIARISAGRRSPDRTEPVRGLRTVPASRSTSTLSPSRTSGRIPGQTRTGRPMAMALRRKIRANDSATTQATPRALRFSGAVSRLEPHPKFRPAITRSPGRTCAGNLLSSDSSVWVMRTSTGSIAHCPGDSASVLTSSPKHHARPRMGSSMSAAHLSSRGSVIEPVTADAATVAGEAR